MKSQETNRFGRMVIVAAFLTAGSGFAYAAAVTTMDAGWPRRRKWFTNNRNKESLRPNARRGQALKAEEWPPSGETGRSTVDSGNPRK